MLTLNGNILWTFLNLLIMYFLFKKFLFEPVNNIMEKRASQIDNSLKDAEDKNIEADAIKLKYETALTSASNQANEIIEKAQIRASNEYDNIVKSASENANQIIIDANKSIEIEKEKAIRDIQSQVADIAIILAQKVTEKNIGFEENKQIVNEFLAEAGKAYE